MSDQYKVFHFQELDWLLYFPTKGNKGKYSGYSVLFKEKKETQTRQVVLGSVLERPEVEERYPHTVGFFKAHNDNEPDSAKRYMEIRKVQNVDDFWLFLNALNL